MAPEIEAALDQAPAYLRDRISSFFRMTQASHTVAALDASSGAVAALVSTACAAGVKTVVLPTNFDDEAFGATKALISALKHAARYDDPTWLIMDCSPEWVTQSTMENLNTLFDDNKVFCDGSSKLPKIWPLPKNAKVVLFFSTEDIEQKFKPAFLSRTVVVNFASGRGDD